MRESVLDSSNVVGGGVGGGIMGLGAKGSFFKFIFTASTMKPAACRGNQALNESREIDHTDIVGEGAFTTGRKLA